MAYPSSAPITAYTGIIEPIFILFTSLYKDCINIIPQNKINKS
jgi:hypothetical protein